MTDEEKAEEYIKSNNLEWELECHRTSPIGEVKQAYLAVLKAATTASPVASAPVAVPAPTVAAYFANLKAVNVLDTFCNQFVAPKLNLNIYFLYGFTIHLFKKHTNILDNIIFSRA